MESIYPRGKRLSGDERLNRSRERNRMHARRTREKKKTQAMVLQQRITELYDEGYKLRQIVDEHFTATSLLGLSKVGSQEENGSVLTASQVCGDYYQNMMNENSWLKEGTSMSGLPSISLDTVSTEKRVRTIGKYSPQERDQIRRERNRLHAKKTRDRKKFLLETSEKTIWNMEEEVRLLRTYLLDNQILTEEDYDKMVEKDRQNYREAHRMHQYEDDDEGEDDEEDNEEDPRDTYNEYSMADHYRSQSNAKKSNCMEEDEASGGSEEKRSNWSGSTSQITSKNDSTSDETRSRETSGSESMESGEGGESGDQDSRSGDQDNIIHRKMEVIQDKGLH